MLTVSQAQDRASALIQAAKKAGADAADVLYVADASTGVQVRLGELEDVERSEGEEIGLRFFLGSRSASVSSSDLSDEALGALVERAAAMAREAPEDAYAGLAPEDRLLKGDPVDVQGDDGRDPLPVELKALALATEDAARAVPGVTNSEGASVSAGRSLVALATSHGFCRGYTTSGYSGSASVIAGTGSDMQRDYASHSTRYFEDLDGPEEIGRLAAERTVARLNPARVPSGTMPIVYHPRVGGSLIGHLLSAITGAAIARKTSFLIGREDEPVFAENIFITDDPHRPRGLRSKPFDGEGIPTKARELVSAGRVTGWLMDSASARQLGLEPTGHATRGIGGSPGSRGASGFLIENGEITVPVAEITIAGNLLDMFRALVPADDLELRRAVNVPTLRIDGMTVAGA